MTSGHDRGRSMPGSWQGQPPSRLRQHRRHSTGRVLVADGPEQHPEQVRHPFVADLLPSLPGPGGQVGRALDTVLLLARASCPSCVAVSLTLDDGGRRVTVTATTNPAVRHAPSLTVRLPRSSSNRPAAQPSVLVVFATDGLALARLAVGLSVLLGAAGRRVTLAVDAPIPPPMIADLVLAGQLADQSAIDRALGVLLEQGWVLTDGRRELQRRADTAGASLVQAAANVLAALPPTPPSDHNDPLW